MKWLHWSLNSAFSGAIVGAAKVVQLGFSTVFPLSALGEPMKLHLPRKPARRRFQSWAPVQVAAICYRRSPLSLDFLLVNTSSGKWTFPKGRLCPWLSPSEAAAREALEEAGARGRIQETSFAQYLDLKRALGHDNRSREVLIAAYLLEVRSLSDPFEEGRNPTWFALEEARQRLAEQRADRYAQEVTGIVDAAWRTVRQAEKKLLARAQSRSRRLLAQG
jgi:8-oxo-dGTP pyrophosphatase MutT (NUDIX family)